MELSEFVSIGHVLEFSAISLICLVGTKIRLKCGVKTVFYCMSKWNKEGAVTFNPFFALTQNRSINTPELPYPLHSVAYITRVFDRNAAP